MKKNSMFFCVSILFIGLQSCTKDADVKLPEVDPKLVISSFISPQDSLIQVAVSLSSPFYNNSTVSSKYDPLLNATVIIEDGSSTYNLIYNSKLERYVIDSFQLKIREGITYKLSVSKSNGKLATANTTIPLANHSLKYKVTTDPREKNRYILYCEWQDPVNEVNYYLFRSNYTSYYLFYHSNINGSSIDTIKCWRGETKYFDDIANDGGIFNLNSNFEYQIIKNDTVFANLTIVTKEYISYYDKLNKATAVGDPFSEPVQMYTNITKGLGIFTGLNKYTIRILP